MLSKHGFPDLRFRVSIEPVDLAWDAFLNQTPLGQFQQSSAWARIKAPEGWTPLRVIAEADSAIVGGFQILMRKRGLGFVGYISKGPVLLPGFSRQSSLVIGQLKFIARRHAIRAFVLQPPDECTEFPASFSAAPFQANRILKVNDATLRICVSQGTASIERRMAKNTKRNCKNAVRQGVRIRECSESDLPKFFELMCSTCARQGASPNPPNLEALRGLWNAFASESRIRITFAEFNGEIVSGGLFIKFGNTVTFWKKGWSGEHANKHPNELLIFEALGWAHENGCQFFDFGGLNRSIAIALLKDQPLTDDQVQSRDYFHIRFGGEPRLLPEARVYIPNPALSAGYRIFMPVIQKMRTFASR